jgi:hypothetical protein
MILLTGLTQSTFAVTYTTLVGGVWSTDGTTSCGCVPTSSSVKSGDAIVVTYSASIPGPFTLGNNSSLTVTSGTLTITGGPANGGLTFDNGSHILIGTNGDLRVSGNFENKNQSDDVTFNGDIRIDGNFVNGTGGSDSAVIDFGPGATISIGGTCANSGHVNDPNGSYPGCTGPLPVKLINFRGQQKGVEVLLSWATASEQGFKYFAVERADEQLQWTEIGQVNGNGDSHVRIDYTFTDAFPNLIGKIYYRLKAVDLDGYTEYFNVIFVNFSAPKAWFVSPNPANSGKVVLNRNFADEQPVVAAFYNVSGAELYREQFTFKSSQHVFNTNFKPGVYILTLTSGNIAKRIKLVVE